MKKHGFFHTPKDIDELNDWIERHDPDSRVHLYTLQGMYYNLIVENFNLSPKSYVARLDLPKQRATAPLSVVMKDNGNGDYSTHILNREQDSLMYGHYDMGFEEAMKDFQERCKSYLAYDSNVYELAEQKTAC